MTKTIIKITFSNGRVGYYKSSECITSVKDNAKVFDKKYAGALCEGLNFAINTYNGAFTKKAELEEVK